MLRHPLLVSFVTCSVAVALGCSGGPTCGEGTVEKDKECVAAEPSETDPAPAIVSFTASQAELTAGGTVSFAARVSDPQGPTDIAFAQVLGTAGESYGVFSSAGDEDWTFTATWADLDGVDPIDFRIEEERTFVARFTDFGGSTDEAAVTVRLHCDGLGACAGTCLDLDTDAANCGACGHACDDGVCYYGACRAEAACVDALEGTCTDICVAQGYADCLVDDSGAAGIVYDTTSTCATFTGSFTTEWPIPHCAVDLRDYNAGDIVYCICADAG